VGELIKLSDYRDVDPVLEMLAFLHQELLEQIEMFGESKEPLYFQYSNNSCPCCGRSNEVNNGL